MINLNPEDLTLVKDILQTWVPEYLVWAYGSRVVGNSHEGSDLDLILIHPLHSNIPYENMAALRAAFAESNLPILIDILDWARIPKTFQEEIKEQHEIIQLPAN